jgi:hypothetical protein
LDTVSLSVDRRPRPRGGCSPPVTSRSLPIRSAPPAQGLLADPGRDAQAWRVGPAHTGVALPCPGPASSRCRPRPHGGCSGNRSVTAGTYKSAPPARGLLHRGPLHRGSCEVRALVRGARQARTRPHSPSRRPRAAPLRADRHISDGLGPVRAALSQVRRLEELVLEALACLRSLREQNHRRHYTAGSPAKPIFHLHSHRGRHR